MSYRKTKMDKALNAAYARRGLMVKGRMDGSRHDEVRELRKRTGVKKGGFLRLGLEEWPSD